MGAYWLRRLITPHGDWKHPEYKDYPPPYSVLITPHGDWKLDTSMAPYNTLMSHYPSWGLETSCGLTPSLWAERLITPHGDWKPLEISRTEEQSLYSLPLMGIGNTRGEDGTIQVEHFSLPLMGIGNSTLRDRGLAVSGGSLPLMGIGNPVQLVVVVKLVNLITPHGDWKRDRGCEHTAAVGALITPHGDWKQPLLRSQLLSKRSHYPSWGLETVRCRLCVAPVHGLITPHGDWKRAPRGTA